MIALIFSLALQAAPADAIDQTNPARVWAGCASALLVRGGDEADAAQRAPWSARARRALAQAKVARNTEGLSSQDLDAMAVRGAEAFNVERATSPAKRAEFDKLVTDCARQVDQLPAV